MNEGGKVQESKIGDSQGQIRIHDGTVTWVIGYLPRIKYW